VVPIQANLSGSKRNNSEMRIAGFLCCDNMSGGFGSNEVKDFLSAIGDLLYSQLALYNQFTKLAKERRLTNENLREYDIWVDGR
jgi:hypothetical protein